VGTGGGGGQRYSTPAEQLWILSQGNGSVMTAAMESGNPSFWAGYGIPSTPGEMEGANAIIVKPCATCPTGPRAPPPHASQAKDSSSPKGYSVFPTHTPLRSMWVY